MHPCFFLLMYLCGVHTRILQYPYPPSPEPVPFPLPTRCVGWQHLWHNWSAQAAGLRPRSYRRTMNDAASNAASDCTCALLSTELLPNSDTGVRQPQTACHVMLPHTGIRQPQTAFQWHCMTWNFHVGHSGPGTYCNAWRAYLACCLTFYVRPIALWESHWDCCRHHSKENVIYGISHLCHSGALATDAPELHRQNLVVTLTPDAIWWRVLQIAQPRATKEAGITGIARRANTSRSKHLLG